MTPDTIAGAHYLNSDAGESHHTRVSRLGMGWYAANITKYAERANYKGERGDDIIKIVHYAILWAEAAGLTPVQFARFEGVLNSALHFGEDGSEPGLGYVNQDR